MVAGVARGTRGGRGLARGLRRAEPGPPSASSNGSPRMPSCCWWRRERASGCSGAPSSAGRRRSFRDCWWSSSSDLSSSVPGSPWCFARHGPAYGRGGLVLTLAGAGFIAYGGMWFFGPGEDPYVRPARAQPNPPRGPRRRPGGARPPPGPAPDLRQWAGSVPDGVRGRGDHPLALCGPQPRAPRVARFSRDPPRMVVGVRAGGRAASRPAPSSRHRPREPASGGADRPRQPPDGGFLRRRLRLPGGPVGEPRDRDRVRRCQLPQRKLVG